MPIDSKIRLLETQTPIVMNPKATDNGWPTAAFFGEVYTTFLDVEGPPPGVRGIKEFYQGV